MKRFIPSVLFFLGLALLWEGVVRLHLWSPVLLPPPISVGRYLKEAAADGSLWQATLITMRRLLTGYVVGIVGGIPLG